MENLNQYTLNDTVLWMGSADWKERMVAEYWQTKIRYNNLHDMLVKYEAEQVHGAEGALGFTPNCSLQLLKDQAAAMGKTLYILEMRQVIEKVDKALYYQMPKAPQFCDAAN